MTTKVKICGITNIDDALDAIELGADYLGFIFYPESKRFISPEKFAEILDDIPFEIKKVGVFVNSDPEMVIDLAVEFELDFLQFHGDEKPEYCNQFGRPFIKAIRPQNISDLEAIKKYECEFVLIDSFVQGSFGGTGIVSNWDLARKAKDYKPLFLSGGLKTENVQTAISTVQPFAVDVCSGVEQRPGIKDYHKMEEFIKRVKGSDS